jgi:hypothetical protein
VPQIIGHITRCLVALEDSEGRITWFHSTDLQSAVTLHQEQDIFDPWADPYKIRPRARTTITIELGEFIMGVGMPDFSDRHEQQRELPASPKMLESGPCADGNF